MHSDLPKVLELYSTHRQQVSPISCPTIESGLKWMVLSGESERSLEPKSTVQVDTGRSLKPEWAGVCRSSMNRSIKVDGPKISMWTVKK